MISFNCEQCGKPQLQSDEAAGSLVHCECGHGNRVPGANASDVSEPSLDAENVSLPQRKPPDLVRIRQPWLRPHDPTRCLNHVEIPAQQTCTSCGEAFCKGCIIDMEGQTYCGPCKNYRVRQLLRPPRFSALALVATILGLFSAPIAFCMSVIPLGVPEATPAVVMGCGLLGLILPLTALLLGFLALRDIENNPQVGGRALAMTGTALGALGTLWSLIVTLLLIAKQFAE